MENIYTKEDRYILTKTKIYISKEDRYHEYIGYYNQYALFS